jgi:hypothetical protein
MGAIFSMLIGFKGGDQIVQRSIVLYFAVWRYQVVVVQVYTVDT